MKSWPFTLLIPGALALVSLLSIESAAVQSTSSTGTLKVSSTGRGPQYIEGAIVYFRVRSGNSGWIQQSLRKYDEPSVFSLPAADYEVESFVRPCDGNCAALDPPTDFCSAKISVKAGQTATAVRHQTSSGKCTLTVSSAATKKP